MAANPSKDVSVVRFKQRNMPDFLAGLNEGVLLVLVDSSIKLMQRLKSFRGNVLIYIAINTAASLGEIYLFSRDNK